MVRAAQSFENVAAELMSAAPSKLNFISQVWGSRAPPMCTADTSAHSACGTTERRRRQSETTTFTFGVNNLFDNLPQTPRFNGIIVDSDNDGTVLGDNQEQANTYPSTYDVLGRDFFVSANFKF